MQSGHFGYRQAGPVMNNREIAMSVAFACRDADVIHFPRISRVPKDDIPRLPIRFCALVWQRLRVTPKKHDKIAAAPMVNVGVGLRQGVLFLMRANVRRHLPLQIHAARPKRANNHIGTNADIGRRFAPAIIVVPIAYIGLYLPPQFRKNPLLKRRKALLVFCRRRCNPYGREIPC